jgi:xylulokinase
MATLTKWFRDNFCEAEIAREKAGAPNAYEQLSQAASRIPAGSEGLMVLPYFCGERHPFIDPVARGLFIGLTPSHTKHHLYRALLEGVAFNIRHNIEVLSESAGEITGIVSGGGGTRSRLWAQIVSDVAGYEQAVPTIPTGAEIGAAYMAGLAVGVLKDLSELSAHTLDGADWIHPRPENRKLYQRLYPLFRSLYPKVRTTMHRLASINDVNI